jgi:hypothetical protein
MAVELAEERMITMMIETRTTAVRPALDPRHYVFGVIDDPIDAIVAIEALHHAGFNESDMVVDGPAEFAGVRIATAPQSTPPGPSGALAVLKSTETFWTRFVDQVSAGHTVIQVYAPDLDAFDRALEVLELHQAHAV